MKKILSLVIFAFTTSVVSAQINQGQWMIGGNASFSSSKYSDTDESTTDIVLNPNFGYFFIDNFAGGLRLSLESTKEEGEDEAFSTFSVSPFLRYYFLPSAQKVNVFLEGSYGIGSTGQGDRESFNVFSFMAGPAIFLTENVALEFALQYQSFGGDAIKIPGSDRFNSYGINVGFQIHLGSGATRTTTNQ
jgi:hypothetical protein